jgi:hypothetical protein
MNNQRTAGNRSARARAVLGIAFLLSVAAPIFAQRPGSAAPPVDRTNQARARQQDMSKREWQLRNFGNPEVTKDRRRLEALMAQTEEDFNTMLSLHNEIVRSLGATKPLDYQFISKATGEIRKRAHSIQTNINLTPAADEIKPIDLPATTNESEMKDGLVKLCKQIRSFVTNPVIAEPQVIDVDKRALAMRDLESVIQLSAHLKRDADLLKVQK